MLLLSLLFGFCTTTVKKKKSSNTKKKESHFYLCFVINVLETDSQLSEINTKCPFIFFPIDFNRR